MERKLAGKVAVVTGAGNGIGRAEAIALARQGASVIVNDLGGTSDGTGCSYQAADSVVREIKENGDTAIANYDSVANSLGADKIIQSALDNFGQIDILVNNAGIVNAGSIFDLTEDHFDSTLKVHLYGHFYCSRSACRIFKQQRSGRIINTSSTAGLGLIGGVHYSAAKEAIVGFTRSLALEMAQYNVTCNAIRPAAITRMTQAANSETANMMTHQHWMNVLASPMVMKSTPADIAPFVVFLASDEAANLTGRTFYICKGQISLYSEPTRIESVFSDDTWTLDMINRGYSHINIAQSKYRVNKIPGYATE